MSIQFASSEENIVTKETSYPLTGEALTISLPVGFKYRILNTGIHPVHVFRNEKRYIIHNGDFKTFPVKVPEDSEVRLWSNPDGSVTIGPYRFAGTGYDTRSGKAYFLQVDDTTGADVPVLIDNNAVAVSASQLQATVAALIPATTVISAFVGVVTDPLALPPLGTSGTMNGSFAISQSNGHVYVLKDGTWQDQGSLKGDKGNDGAVGPIGKTGSIGPVGPQGLVGPVGGVGPQGLVGATGAIGPVGPQGLQGLVGPVGNTGSVGGVGPQGVQGPSGVVSVVSPLKYDATSKTLSVDTALLSGTNTGDQVLTLVNGALNLSGNAPVALPLPYLPFNVAAGALAVGSAIVAGMVADRPLKLTGFTFATTNVTGTSLSMTFSILVNGTSVPSGNVAVPAGATMGTVTLPTPMILAKNDRIEINRSVALAVAASSGATYGAFIATYA